MVESIQNPFNKVSPWKLCIHRFLQHIIEVIIQCLWNTGIQIRCRQQQNFFKALKSTAKGEIFTILKLLFADGTQLHKHWERSTTRDGDFHWGMWLVQNTNSSQKNRSYDAKTPFKSHTTRPFHNKKNGAQLSVCSSFKYLRNMIANDALLNIEIKTRIGQATAVISNRMV